MTVGITGHQMLSNYEVSWIRDSILDFLSMNNVIKGYSSLAIGTDQLFVKCLLERKIKFDVVLPCDNYDKTFKVENDLKVFYCMLGSANKIVKLKYNEPSEMAFYQAGIAIVELSDIIIAVWDEQPAKGLGGTADIVILAVQKGKRVFHINPVNKTKHFI